MRSKPRSLSKLEQELLANLKPLAGKKNTKALRGQIVRKATAVLTKYMPQPVITTTVTRGKTADSLVGSATVTFKARTYCDRPPLSG